MKLFKFTGFLVLGVLSCNLWGASSLADDYGSDDDTDWATRLASGRIAGKISARKPLSESEQAIHQQKCLAQRAKNHERLMLEVKIASTVKKLVKNLPVEIRKQMMLIDAGVKTKTGINEWIACIP